MAERIQLDIDPELADVCWKLTDEELSFLEASIQREGCREPIRYWVAPDGRKLIVDGHNRYLICQKLNVDYPVVEVPFRDMAAAVEWCIRNQLGRRNVSEVQKSHLRGKLYIERMESSGEPLSDQPDLKTLTQPVPPVVKPLTGSKVCTGEWPTKRVAMQVAEETGVTERQVHRDSKFAKAMGRLAQKSPELRDAALLRNIDKADAIAISEASLEVIRGIEASPMSDWRGCVKAAAKAMEQKKPSIPSGRPVVDIRELAEMEKQAGIFVRAKTKALKACGDAEWAKKYEAQIRTHMNAIFDLIMEWTREASNH